MPLWLRLCVWDRLTHWMELGLQQTHFWGILLAISTVRKKNNKEDETETKYVFVKWNPKLKCRLLCHTLDWTERWHAAGFFSSPSVRWGCSGPPHIKNPLNPARSSIYSMHCRWQECLPGRRVAVWVQWMLRWWVSWVQTQAGPLTLRCLAFITQMGEGFSLLQLQGYKESATGRWSFIKLFFISVFGEISPLHLTHLYHSAAAAGSHSAVPMDQLQFWGHCLGMSAPITKHDGKGF